jgi:serine protease Do
METLVKRTGLVVVALGLVLSLPVPARAQARAAAADVSATVETTTRLVNPAVVEIVTTAYTVGDGSLLRAADLVAKQRSSGSGGDVVLAIDGNPIENGRQVYVTLYRRLAGEVVTLEILRDGQTRRVPVAMGERHDPLTASLRPIDPRRNLVPRLDMLGVNVDANAVQRLRWLRMRAGVLVVSNVPGAFDSRQNELVPGDVVFGLNRTPVTGLDDLRAALEALTPGEAGVLHVERRGERMYLEFTVE